MPSATSPVRPTANISNQARFATNKLIQNLGSNPAKYSFTGNLRTVHGRD